MNFYQMVWLLGICFFLSKIKSLITRNVFAANLFSLYPQRMNLRHYNLFLFNENDVISTVKMEEEHQYGQ